MIALGPGDAAVARRVFGTADTGAIWLVLEELVGPFTCFHLGSSFGIVFGLELGDARRVFVKGLPPGVSRERLEATRLIQLALRERGLPAPRPLVGPVPVGPGHVVVDEWLAIGDFCDTHDPRLRRTMARRYAELLRLATELAPDPPFPPALEGLWERPHNPRFDFTRADGRWIDAAAAAVCRAVVVPGAGSVVGHADWNAQHVRWVGDEISAIYDWDLVRDAEENLVGYASAVFTATWELDIVKAPSPAESEAFVADYERASGRQLDRERVRAARTYLTAYVARCELSDLGREGDFQRVLKAELGRS